MRNGMISYIKKAVDGELKEKLTEAAKEDAIKKTLELFDVTVDDEGVLETGTWEPLVMVGKREWLRPNGDTISYDCSGYVDSPTDSIQTFVNVKITGRNQEPFKINVRWRDGEIESIDCSTSINRPDNIFSLSEISYGFDKCNVRYLVSKFGYLLTIIGTDGDHTYEKHISTDIDDLTHVYEREDGAGNSFFYQVSDGYIRVGDSDNNVSILPVSKLEEEALFLFGRVSRSDRNVEARNFAIDCISLDYPKLRDVAESLSAPWKLIISASDGHHFVTSESDERVFEALANTKTSRFRTRYQEKGHAMSFGPMSKKD